MKRILRKVLLVSIVLSLPCRISVAAEGPKYVPVASYVNRFALGETVGVRAAVGHRVKWRAIFLIPCWLHPPMFHLNEF
jgi:hypothetical protein